MPSAQRLLKGILHPLTAIDQAAPVLRGALFRLRMYPRRARVEVRPGLRLTAGLRIWGEGRVFIGEGVQVDGTMHTVTMPTYGPAAEIRIGAGTFVNGTRFGAASKISVGERCILGDCRIMDTSFHSIYPGARHDPRLVRTSPVVIEDDCWIGAGAFILPGTRIGRGSTVAAGAVVMGRFRKSSVIAGNPAEVIMTVGEPPPAGEAEPMSGPSSG